MRVWTAWTAWRRVERLLVSAWPWRKSNVVRQDSGEEVVLATLLEPILLPNASFSHIMSHKPPWDHVSNRQCSVIGVKRCLCVWITPDNALSPMATHDRQFRYTRFPPSTACWKTVWMGSIFIHHIITSLLMNTTCYDWSGYSRYLALRQWSSMDHPDPLQRPGLYPFIWWDGWPWDHLKEQQAAHGCYKWADLEVSRSFD